MRKNLRDEEGLSLVEVLASIVILGIVFVSFMMIFPQMTLFNKKTEAKLETMNLARQEIALIKKNSYSSPLKQGDILLAFGGTVPPDVPEGVIRINYDKNDYLYEVDFYTEPVLGFDSESHPENIELYKVHLKVLVDGKQNSESYGYIEADK